MLDEWIRVGEHERIRSSLQGIDGIGEYCLNHMLVLLGIYTRIPVDTEVLRYLRNVYHDGKPVAPAVATERFSRYSEFAYLAYKFSRILKK